MPTRRASPAPVPSPARPSSVAAPARKASAAELVTPPPKRAVTTRAPAPRNASRRAAREPAVGGLGSPPPREKSSRAPGPPATRTTSVTDSTTRAPSGSRTWWTTRSSALATCSRTAECGSPTPAIRASVSIRRSASEGELACTVVSEPSCPVLSAWSMSSASAPRTSPTTMRSGRIRSALRTSCLIVTSPRPSRLAGRASSLTTCRCRSLSSAASSIVTIRSSPGIAPERALSVVVLPEPVPPLTSTEARAATHIASSSASSAGSVPPPTRSRSEKPSRRKRRTVRQGPLSDSGGITTFTREPSARRASQSGEASSTRRPSGARIRSIACTRSASESNATSVRSSRPRRST